MRAAAVLAVLGTAYAQYELSIERKPLDHQDNVFRMLKRQVDGTNSTTLAGVLTTSSGGGYYANLTLGNPPQPQVVLVDTGSSDLFVNSVTAAACQNTVDKHSCRGGTFDKTKSSTFQDLGYNFNASYLDGTGLLGSWVEDTMQIAGVSIPDVQFGLAETINSTVGKAFGIMGIGYSARSASKTGRYPNVPEVLKAANVTQSRSYSIWLNTVKAGSGSILFGGIDTSKYTGQLQVFNLLKRPVDGGVNEFYTTITDIGTYVNGKAATIVSGGKDDNSALDSTSNNAALPVILDSGSAGFLVPDRIYSAIKKQFSYVDAEDTAPCSYRNSGDYFNLTFGGKTNIKVTMSEFLVPIYDATTKKTIPIPGTKDVLCSFMLTPGSDLDTEKSIVGDSVLRSMYVAFDLDLAQVGIAQANADPPSTSNIVKITGKGIAAAVSGAGAAARQTNLVANQASLTQVYTASVLATPLGTATGLDAVLTEFRPSDAVAGIYGATANSAATSSKGAAAGLAVPDFAWGGVLSMTWMSLMAVAGAAMML